MQALRHVLVGTDFSPCAETALNFALRLGAEKLTLVHVCELELGHPDDEVIDRCRAKLDALVASCAGREIAGLLRTGKAGEKLLNAAAEVGASVIVLGRVGFGGGSIADGLPLGVIANHVLRRTSRPVLIVPSLDRMIVEVA